MIQNVERESFKGQNKSINEFGHLNKSYQIHIQFIYETVLEFN